jgi:anti-sigma B factor antagonist
VPYMNCPSCGLKVTARASSPHVDRCPRCLARQGIPVTMTVSEVRAWAPATSTPTAYPVANRRSQIAPASRERPAGPDALSIRVKREADALVLALYGELDLGSAPRLGRELESAALSRSRLVIDLSGLEFIDSTGLLTLLEANTRCEHNGCGLSLLRGPRRVHRVFEITGTQRELRFDD